jgi:sn-glycerol 3-phosphate transport system ATP-binding protein
VSAPFVELRGVTRRWNGAGGVADVTLSVEAGRFVSVLGPSGCGKSTLLRLLAGLDRPQTGVIRIAGRDVTDLPASQRGLSMVFQSYALFPHLDVRENVVFGLKVRRLPKPEREAKLGEAVAMMGLEGLERRKPAELSGGQRQRVALARAVVSGHPLCLMDEPLSNLDAKLRHSVRRDIKALQRRLGLTVIYVTHDQAEAMSLSDTVVLMREGRVEQIGPPEALHNRPASTFAADFVGDPPMALIEGGALGLGDGLSVGIRPRAIVETAPEAGDLIATVADSEFLGDETRVALAHEAARGLCLYAPGAATRPRGARIGLRLPKENRVLFDARTGRAVEDPQPDLGADSRQAAPRDGRAATPLAPTTANQMID